MNEMPTVTVDEKLFQEVKRQHARVLEARGEYESSREETKRYKASLEGAQSTLEVLVRRLTSTADDLPLFKNQSEQIEAANADPIVRKIVDRLISLGHDVNALIVMGYTEEERGQVLVWLDVVDQVVRDTPECDTPVLPDPPAFLLPQPLTPVEIADLMTQIGAEGYLCTMEELAERTAVDIANLRHWLKSSAAVKAEKGDAVTFDDLPTAPEWLTALAPDVTGDIDQDDAEHEAEETSDDPPQPDIPNESRRRRKQKADTTPKLGKGGKGVH